MEIPQPPPALTQSLHVMQFSTAQDSIAVLFSELPQTCHLRKSRDGFAQSVSALAEAWRTGRAVKVQMLGAVEIVSAAAP